MEIVADLESVARACDVSRMAVSLALRGKPGVSKATRRRILAAAREQGYRPNPLVGVFQSYVRSRRGSPYQATIAWINDHPNPAFWRTTPWVEGYLPGAVRRAEQLGFKLEEFFLGSPEGRVDPRKVERLHRTLQSRGIFGVILPWLFDPETMRHNWSGFSVAMIGRGVGYRGEALAATADPLFHHASADVYYNLSLAWNSVREKGACRVGLCLTRLNDALVESQQRACFHILQERVPKRERVPALVEQDFKPGGREARALVEWYASYRPDTILTYDAHLHENFRPAQRRGLSIVLLNRTRETLAFPGVDNRRSMIGSAAIDLVVAQFHANERGRPTVTREVLIRGGWSDPAAAP